MDLRATISGQSSLKKSRFLAVALHQIDVKGRAIAEHDSQDSTGKTAARAEIKPSRRSGHESNELGAIEDMPFPKLAQLRRRRQIYARRPVLELALELLEPLHRFT